MLDLTRVLAGPTCTQMLGDLGAEVIKIERPGSRRRHPRLRPALRAEHQGKRLFPRREPQQEVASPLDIAKPEGQAIVHRLLAECDILVENFKVGALAKYGLGWEQLGQKFPRLIYCSITGFGQTGPYAPRPGYDALIQAMGGVMSLTGEPDGSPQKVGVPVADLFAGLYGCIGILAAVNHRDTHWAGPADRYRHAGHACGLAGQPGHELPRHRRKPAAPRQPAPEHRALPGIPDQGRLHHPGRRQRPDLRALLQGHRPGAPAGRRTLRHQPQARRQPRSW